MERQAGSQTINNAFYDELGEGWYAAFDHPIALLRAENQIRIPWILQEIQKRIGKAFVLDVGCGAGMLANALAGAGHTVAGIDLSKKSLEIAQKNDASGRVAYKQASAYALPFQDRSLDVVCATDVLEHVDFPLRLIQEASRVLKQGGLFFFHTFNRTVWSYLLVIKALEWFVPNTPRNMHVYPLFIKPKELGLMAEQAGLSVFSLKGLRPCFSKALWKLPFSKAISRDLSFRFCKTLATGYCGIAEKVN